MSAIPPPARTTETARADAGLAGTARADAGLADAAVCLSSGLHARPSVRFTRLAKAHASAISVALDASGPWVDAKSIVRVMGLKASENATLYLRAEGADADVAIASLVRFLERGQDEGAGHAVAV
jgi:phosphocarrier protein